MQNNLPHSELQPDYIGDTGRRGADYISQPFAFLMALTEKGSEHIKQWICHGTAAHAVCHKAIIATLQHNDPCNIDGDLLYQWHRRPSSSLQSLTLCASGWCWREQAIHPPSNPYTRPHQKQHKGTFHGHGVCLWRGVPWWVFGEQECVEALIVFHWVYLMSIVYISLPQAHVHLTCLFVFLLYIFNSYFSHYYFILLSFFFLGFLTFGLSLDCQSRELPCV